MTCISSKVMGLANGHFWGMEKGVQESLLVDQVHGASEEWIK